MGFALLYQSFSVVTALYFRKRLATAYAIGRSGMGLTFALAPFTQLLLDQYAWQGSYRCTVAKYIEQSCILLQHLIFVFLKICVYIEEFL